MSDDPPATLPEIISMLKAYRATMKGKKANRRITLNLIIEDLEKLQLTTVAFFTASFSDPTKRGY